MIRLAAAALLIAGAFLLNPGRAAAALNYRCLQTCEQAGYRRDACVPRCTVRGPAQSTAPASPQHGTDYRCVDRCTGTGRSRPYCVRNCSY